VWRVILDYTYSNTEKFYPRSMPVARSKCRKSLATFNVALAVILIHSHSNYLLRLEIVRLGNTIVRLARGTSVCTVATVVTCYTIVKDGISHRREA
jgi:hypothetical protein